MVSPNPPLRVLMTADPFGGVWTLSLDLMRELGGSGVQFALATMGRKLDPAQRNTATRLPNVRLYESDFKIEWMDDPWEDVNRAADWLLEISAEFRPHVVHLNGYVHAALRWDRPVLVAAHSCVYSWHSAVKGLPPPRESWSRYHRHVRQGLSAAAIVTAPSEAMLKAIGIHYGNTFPSGRVIYGGRPPHLFSAGEKEPFILTGGRLWDEAKNMRLLDKAAATITWPIRAAGEEESPNGGGIRLARLRQLGPLSPELFADQLSRASIFALPSRYEPFGLAALEAAFSGCALVLGDIPSLREIWGDAALFVTPNKPGAWASALQRLICDPGLRAVLVRRARERAVRFTAERMATHYLAAYRSILSKEVIKPEGRPLLSLTPAGLESWQRALPPWVCD